MLVEKPSDHPFYVYEQGWASCKPDLTLAEYGLPCQQLKVGDVCVFLSDRIESSRSDKLTSFEAPSVDDGRKQASFGEASKFLTSQTAHGREQLSRDGQQQNGNKTEIAYEKGSPFENLEKSDNSFGQPAVKKAKMDGMAGKSTQDGVTN